MIIGPKTTYAEMERYAYAQLEDLKWGQLDSIPNLTGSGNIPATAQVIHSLKDRNIVAGTANMTALGLVLKIAGICPLKAYADLTGSAIDYARNILQSMLKYLPTWLRADYADILRAQGVELRALNSAAENGLNEFFVQTSTARIAEWETFTGLKEADKPIEQRRARVLSKLKGYGTVTSDFLKEIALTYENGVIDVVEDVANSKITICFVGLKGIPPNESDFLAIVHDVIPAHLALAVAYTYNTYSRIQHLTYAQMQNFSWQQLNDSNDLP